MHVKREAQEVLYRKNQGGSGQGYKEMTSYGPSATTPLNIRADMMFSPYSLLRCC
jgi:hypothetical protein